MSAGLQVEFAQANLEIPRSEMQRSDSEGFEVESETLSSQFSSDQSRARSSEDARSVGSLVNVSSLGATEPPALILPVGDHGTPRRGSRLSEAEPREGNSLGVWGPFVSDSKIEKTETRKIEIAGSVTIQGTPALDSEKSGPRCIQNQLTITIRGIQHTLLALSQGLKQLVSQKRQAQKAHARRERRRANRASGTEYQPSQVPADSPLGLHATVSTADIEKTRVEAEIQPPIEDWTPPESKIVGQHGPSQGIGKPKARWRQATQSDLVDLQYEIWRVTLRNQGLRKSSWMMFGFRGGMQSECSELRRKLHMTCCALRGIKQAVPKNPSQRRGT
jgi:hypothetical protein